MSTKLKHFKVLNPESKSRNNKITIVEKSEIQKYFIDDGLKESELNKIYKLTRRVLINSLEYHKFNPNIIAKVKTKKLIQRNKNKAGAIGWENKSLLIDSVIPGFYDKFKNLYSNGEYEKSWELLEELWDSQFKIKLALKGLRKSVKDRLKRKGTTKHLGSVSNQFEWVVLQSITKLGLKAKPQFPLGPYFYDFLIKKEKLIIEVNGSQFHTEEKDKPKIDFAIALGYRVCIIEISKLKKDNYDEFIKHKINQTLRVKESL